MPIIGDQIGLSLDRIIFATDFSPVAEKAAGYARNLAKRFSSSLTLAHVVDLSSVSTRSEGTMVGLPIDEMRHESAENQEQLLDEMTMAGVRTTAHTMESHNPAAALVNFAKELRADLIVTGTNARQGLSKVICGSFAEGVIRHADCPVLTIGPKAKPVSTDGQFSFRTVVFATDFGSNTAIKAAVALSFAQDSVAKIYLSHILEQPVQDIFQIVDLERKFEEKLRSLVPGSMYDWCSLERVVETGAAAPDILALAKRVHADLIVLGAKHSGTWLTHLVAGTVDKVLLDAECPVLTVCAD